MEYEFDEYSLELTTAVLWRINESVRNNHASANDFAEWLKRETKVMIGEPGFWGTSGAYISACNANRNGKPVLFCTASLMAFTVMQLIHKIDAITIK